MRNIVTEAIEAWRALGHAKRAYVICRLGGIPSTTPVEEVEGALDAAIVLLTSAAAEPEAKDAPIRMMADDDIRPCVHGALPYLCTDIECVNCAPEARR